MKKLIFLLPVLSLLCFQVKAQDKKTLIERINEVEEIPVYVLFQSIGRSSINTQELQTVSKVTFTPGEIKEAQAKVIEMGVPDDFKTLADSIVEILNKQFETQKFIKAPLTVDNFKALGAVDWSFEKRQLFVFVTVNADYEVSGMDAASRNDDVEKSISLKWRLSINSIAQFSNYAEKNAYKVFASCPAIYEGPVFSVKYIPINVENIAQKYAPSKSVGPFSRKVDFFTARFVEKQKKAYAKTKK